MSVYYKFNAAREYDTLPVDGLHISLGDLKASIIHQKRLGKGDVCDLLVKNAETEEKYEDDKVLIPKNSSLIVARVPVDPSKKRFGDPSKENKELLLMNPEYRMNVGSIKWKRTEGSEEAELMRRRIEEAPDLTKFSGTEEEKIATMMAQSTIDYHPTTYLKLRNTMMTGKVPTFYKCYKCHQKGHWVVNCPLNNSDIKKCTGIPSKFLIEISDPATPGAMITPAGKYVIFNQAMVEDVKAQVESRYIPPPPFLICPICDQMMKDAVLISCCAKAYCDDCIRTHLLEDEEQTCPSCKKTGITPSTLIPNKHLRRESNNYGMTLVTVGDMASSGNQTPNMTKSNTASPITMNASSRVMTPEINKLEDVVKDKSGSEKGHEEAGSISDDDTYSHKAKKKKKEKKPKKEKKEKKAKKDKKEKKEKKGKKTDTDENLMNQAVCPTFDPTVPPPNLGSQASVNIYDDIPRPGGVPLYTGVVDDPLAKFEEYLKQKDAKKGVEQKLRSLSPRSPHYRPRTPSRSNIARHFSTVRDTSPVSGGRSGSGERKRRYSPLSPRRSYRDRSSSSRSPSPRFGQSRHHSASRLVYPQATEHRIPTVPVDFSYQAPPQYAQGYPAYTWDQHNMYNLQRDPYYDRNYGRPEGEEQYHRGSRLPAQSWGHARGRAIRGHSDYRHKDDRRFDSRDYRRDRRESPDRKPDYRSSPDGYHRSREDHRRRQERDLMRKRERGYSSSRDADHESPRDVNRRADISPREHRRRELEHISPRDRRKLDPVSPRDNFRRKEGEQISPREVHPRNEHEQISPREIHRKNEQISPMHRRKEHEKTSPLDVHRRNDHSNPREVHRRKEHDPIGPLHRRKELDSARDVRRRELEHGRYESEISPEQKLRKVLRQNELEGRSRNVERSERKSRRSPSGSYMERSAETDKLVHTRSKSRSLTPDDLRNKLKKRDLGERVSLGRETKRLRRSYETDLDKSRSSVDEAHLAIRSLDTSFSDRTSPNPLGKSKKRPLDSAEETNNGVQLKMGKFEIESKEKRKHDKKKKKREKRRLSEISVDVNDEERRKKKKKKKDKVKHKDEATDKVKAKVIKTKKDEVDPLLPEPSKWERDEFEERSPLRGSELSKNETSLVTSDVLKRAEHALFHKRFGSKKTKEDRRSMEQSSSPDTRETHKKGGSIQITISSKTESQIGRPKSTKRASS